MVSGWARSPYRADRRHPTSQFKQELRRCNRSTGVPQRKGEHRQFLSVGRGNSPAGKQSNEAAALDCYLFATASINRAQSHVTGQITYEHVWRP